MRKYDPSTHKDKVHVRAFNKVGIYIHVGEVL